MLTVKEIKESELFGTIKDQIPEECPFCKKLFVVTEDFTTFFCNNEQCTGNLLSAIHRLYDVLGLSLKTEDTELQQIIEDKGILKPFDFFCFPVEFPELQSVKSLPLSLYAKCMGVLKRRPDILPVLFEGYTDFKSFYADIDAEKDKIAWLTSKIYQIEMDTEDFVYSDVLEVLAEIELYKDNLLYASSSYAIKLTDEPVKNICTDRQIRYCKSKTGAYINVVPDITEFTDLYVTNDMQGVRYTIAIQKGIEIITEQEFLRMYKSI